MQLQIVLQVDLHQIITLSTMPQLNNPEMFAFDYLENNNYNNYNISRGANNLAN